MDGILLECKKLNDLIKQSDEYNSYIKARNALLSSKELYNRLMEFRRQYNDIQTYYDGNPYDEVFKICKENDDLLHNSVVSEYLKRETDLAELSKKMIGLVTDGLFTIKE